MTHYVPSVFEAHAIKALRTVQIEGDTANARSLIVRALNAAKALTDSRDAAVKEALEHV